MKMSAKVHGTDGVRAETRRREPGFVMKGHHCHSCYELFYVQDGSCRFLIDDSIHDLGAGDFILVPPMALHYTRYVFGACTRTVTLFGQEDVPDEVLRLLPRGARFLAETRIFHAPVGSRAQIGQLLRQISAEVADDACAAALRRYALLSLLLVCGRVCAFQPDAPAGLQTSDRQVLGAARYISEHYMDPLTTAEVARAVGFSPNYLSRRFRQAAGIGLHEYIVFVRLYHAAQALRRGGGSITAVALSCGFSDSNYFKDAFKKKYGVTPREYRKDTAVPPA